MRFLVAGITGQLGHGLVEATGDRADELVPVVRKRRSLQARARLRRLFPERPELADNAVEGDVTLPFWGLSGQKIEELAPQMDGVINVAADTDWASTERRLHAINTLGAVQGYELTRRLRDYGAPAPVYCWASSVHVAGGLAGLVAERPFGPDAHRTAYEQSKWLGERALLDPCRRLEGPPLAIARMGGLLGNSTTSHSVRRSSLYQLADRWSKLPAGVLPVAAGGRVDMLPRDEAGDLLLRVANAAVRLQPAEPLLVHVCGGEAAPTLGALLSAARSIDHHGRMPAGRTVPVPPAVMLWASENADRFQALPRGWRNLLVGTRYLTFDRIFERARLARVAGRPLPAPTAEHLARLAFELPEVQQPMPRELDRPMTRYAA